MIDLSFLTEEEQEAILTVLKRDAELKKAEEQRVQKLQQNITDKGQLKYLTGEWFYETKQLRHQERIHGTDIIWASMKHTHKPMTILELSQIAPERPSFVNSGNKEVFVPPVLSELLQEPLTQNTQPRNQRDPEVEKPYELQESPKPLVQSPTRQRRNPFNSGPDEAVFTQDNGQLTEGAVQQSNSQMDEYILPTDLINPYGTLQNLHPTNSFHAIPQKSVLTPVPEESMYEDETAEVYGPEDRQSNSVSPRGILKYMLSPTDSPDLGLQSSVIAESPVEAWTDRKQVRFSSAVSSSSVKRQDGKELGEHSLLDVDLIIPSENNSEAENRNTSNSKESEVFVQDGSQQQVLGDHSETCQAEAQKQVSIIISTNQESGKIHMETQADEEAAPQIQSNEKQLTNESSKKSPHAISPKPKQRLFGLFRREKRKNKEDVKESEQKDMQTDNVNLSQAVVETKNEEEKLTEESVSDLKAFWERENIGISARDEKDANIHSPEKTNVETIECNQDGKEKEIASKFPEEIQSVESKFLVEVSQEDCTYRAFPVLIFEDNDDSIICSIPESQICQPKQSPEPLPQQLTESKPTNVGELKSFWESTSAPCSPVRSCKVSELKTSTDTQKKDDVPLSPSKKPIVVNEKGFVGQGIERLPSKGGIGDVHKTWHQVKEGANSQDRPYSPSRSPSKRSKDQDDEVRRSPSKTCHPRVLPRESASSPQGSRPGSPLRTFPIVIDPEDQLVKPTSLPKQKKSPLHETKATIDSATDMCSPKIHRSPEKTPLVRSIVPQDYQHYLGPREQAHLPPFPQTDTAQDTNTLQSPVRELTGRQSGSLPKDPRVSSWIEQIKDCSEEDNTTRAWTLSRASSGYDDKSSPVMSALKRLSSKMSTSKSLEELASPTREAIGQINRSVDDVSEIPSTSIASSMKSSVSVPAIQLDETDSDSPFENNLSWRRNTGSSASNISLSSGMASMSSEVSGSLTSIYHADLCDVDVQGTIQFAVNYIQKLGEFHIFVVHCRDLALGDAKKSRSDPYVKCYLLPDKTKLGKRKTTVKKKTVNPTYNEILRFKLLLEVLKTQHLNISVWHNDTFGRNSFLGEVDLDLSEWDFGNTQMNEYALKARTTSRLTPNPSPTHSVNSRGQMRVALRFLPQTLHSNRTFRVESGEVQIWVKDCKNLPPIRGVIIDPFVKCAVLPDTSRKSRQKTRVVKRTANPMFNHTMVYDGFRPEDLREACVELTVWDHDRLNNHYIGGVRLGLGTGKSYGVDVNWMDSTTTEANLWQKMLESGGEWVEEVLPLRMLLMAKIMSK